MIQLLILALSLVIGAVGVVVAQEVGKRVRERIVRVGDVWELQSPTRFAPTGPALYEVLRQNDSKEAGPGSWVMRHIKGGHELYMHHRARVAGEWALIYRGSWHSARAEQIFGPAAGV